MSGGKAKVTSHCRSRACMVQLDNTPLCRCDCARCHDATCAGNFMHSDDAIIRRELRAMSKADKAKEVEVLKRLLRKHGIPKGWASE